MSCFKWYFNLENESKKSHSKVKEGARVVGYCFAASIISVGLRDTAECVTVSTVVIKKVNIETKVIFENQGGKLYDMENQSP